MYYKNLIKNRNRFLKQDLLIKFPSFTKNPFFKGQLEENRFINKMQLQSNIDFKSFKGVSYNTNNTTESNKNKSLRLLMVYYCFNKITGQLPKFIKVKKSVANWNIRSGMETGIKVTLRKKSLNRFYKKWVIIVWSKKYELQKDNNKNYNNKINNSFFNFSHNEIFSFQPFSFNYSGFLWNLDLPKYKKSNENIDVKLIKKMINKDNFKVHLNNSFITKNNSFFIDNFLKFNPFFLFDFFSDHFRDILFKFLPQNIGFNLIISCNTNKHYINNKFINDFILSYFLFPLY